MRHQLKRLFRNQRWILLLLSLFAFLFHFIFTAILSTAEIRTFANSIYQLIPPVFRSMAGFGDSSNLLSSRLIAFGYNHPASLLMLMFIPISTASRYISAEIENRTIDLLLIRLYPRYRLITGTFLFALAAHTLLFGVMIAGTYTGRMIFGLQKEFTMLQILRVAGIGLLFYTAVTAVVIFIAVQKRERGSTIAVSAGVFLFLYVFDVISQIWDTASFLQPYSLFNFYRPGDIAGGEYSFAQAILVLTALIVLFLLAAVYIFNRKDL